MRARRALSHVSASCLRGRAPEQPSYSQGHLVLVMVKVVSVPMMLGSDLVAWSRVSAAETMLVLVLLV